ncbi:MAG: penicillin acylase family protein [Solirubrobacterales bacterium]
MGLRASIGAFSGAILAVIAAAALPSAAGAETLEALSVLPPGQSGFVSSTGVASGTGSPHLTDQVELFNNFEYKPFDFNQPGTSETPKQGVEIVRDSFGVPSITAQTDADGWWGVGYAVAQDRLFQLELFKRATSGRLAEILGSSYLDDDLIARRDYYTDAEIDAMIAELPEQFQTRIEAYRDGINAWIARVRQTPANLPGEFAALGVSLTDWTVRDSARVGVFLARTVPSSDGAELANAEALEGIGAKNFDTLHPVRTPGRRITVPKSEGTFPAQPGRSRRNEKAGFKKTQKFLAATDLSRVEDTTEHLATRAGVPAANDPGADLRRILPSPGGSFMWAIAGDDRAYQYNGPQLGFSIPELFVEFELHSPELPSIRGVSAAGVPLVGIGHNGNVAWGFTSGLSDEDDLYVEDVTAPETYSFEGAERKMECRDERFDFRSPPTDLPDLPTNPGAPAGSVTERVCRTIHGPVQQTGEGVALARRYAIWGRELETLVGIDMLNKAETIADVDRAMQNVTWNENVIAADENGDIGYWHPGLHQLKPKRWDERLPFPGTGEAEWRGLLPRRQTPNVINPEQGWLANWNNPPSSGWTNGDGEARERLTGKFHRVRILQREVARVTRNPNFNKHTAIVETTGTTAQQFPFFKPELKRARRSANEDGSALLDELASWDGSYHRTAADGTVDASVAIWEEYKDRLEAILLKPMGEKAAILAGQTGASHEFDITNGEAAAIRLLGPKQYGRAANSAATALAERFGSTDPAAWREPRRMYEVGAQGAGSAPDLPFFDRGTWNQSVMVGK